MKSYSLDDHANHETSDTLADRSCNTVSHEEVKGSLDRALEEGQENLSFYDKAMRDLRIREPNLYRFALKLGLNHR